jgi:hypothetical protein
MAFRLLAAVVALALGTTASIASHSSAPERHPDRFEVKFSGQVQAAPTPLPASLKPVVIRAVTYMQNERDFIHAVAVQHNRVRLDTDDSIKTSLQTLACDRMEVSEFLSPNGMAQERRGFGCLGGAFDAVVRYHLRGTSIYQVIAIYKKSLGDQKANEFVQSFRLTDVRGTRTGF